jgi:hypothetical protein
MLIHEKIPINYIHNQSQLHSYSQLVGSNQPIPTKQEGKTYSVFSDFLTQQYELPCRKAKGS